MSTYFKLLFIKIKITNKVIKNLKKFLKMIKY